MIRTLFTNVKVLDCTGALPFAGEVLVEANRIAAIAPVGVPIVCDDAVRIDGGGATLMPGLIEPHSHLSFADTAVTVELGFIPPEEHMLLTARNARRMLDQGFTSCNSAASAKPRLDVALRDAIDRGDLPGPRTLAASPEMTVTAGLGDVRLAHLYRENFAVIRDGAEGFRKFAREMCREGVDTLKINVSGDAGTPASPADSTVMTEAEIDAVCDVARAHGRRVAAHARSAQSVLLCVKHGVEIIYHATLCDEAALDCLEAARDRVFVAPVLGHLYATLHEAGAWGVTAAMGRSRGLDREIEAGIANMRALKARGVRVLPGGDYGFAWNPIGANARDIEHFVKLIGFSPMDAIVSATRLGGEIMMRGNELGQVKPGFLADLLLVDGNPLAGVAILRDAKRLLAIMKDGVLHKMPMR